MLKGAFVDDFVQLGNIHYCFLAVFALSRSLVSLRLGILNGLIMAALIMCANTALLFSSLLDLQN